MKLNKIPLESLLEILQDLYESGFDYIDISGTQVYENNIAKDCIQITVTEDYMLSTKNEIDDINKILSDNDINNLI